MGYSISEMVTEAHATSKEKGWWEYEYLAAEDTDTDIDLTMIIPEKLMLMVTELSEAMEEYRNHKKHIYFHDTFNEKIVGEKDPYRTYADYFEAGSISQLKPEGIVAELADVVIRIGDLCGFFGWDLQRTIEWKMRYNKTRPHRHGGKRA